MIIYYQITSFGMVLVQMGVSENGLYHVIPLKHEENVNALRKAMINKPVGFLPHPYQTNQTEYHMIM